MDATGETCSATRPSDPANSDAIWAVPAAEGAGAITVPASKQVKVRKWKPGKVTLTDGSWNAALPEE